MGVCQNLTMPGTGPGGALFESFGICALCLILLLSCTLIPAFLMWIIWGSMIVDASSHMTDIKSCRARDFWWHMCSAYIGVGAIFVLNCCFKCGSVAFSKGQEIFAGLGLLVQMLFTWIWSIYAITLWAEFNNNPDNIPDKFADCLDFLTFVSKNDELITLWKVTAIWYWILSIIFFGLLVLGIYFIVSQSQISSSEPDTPAEMSEPLLRPDQPEKPSAVTHVGADVAKDGVDPDIAKRTSSMNDDVAAALGLAEPVEEHSALGDDVEEEPAAEKEEPDVDPLLQLSAPDPADTPAAPAPDAEADPDALEQL